MNQKQDLKKEKLGSILILHHFLYTVRNVHIFGFGQSFIRFTKPPLTLSILTGLALSRWTETPSAILCPVNYIHVKLKN